jgi:hypothetical protein
MMSYPPSEYPSDPGSSENYPDYESAEEAWRTQRRRATYLPAVFLALVIGALVGALLSRRQRPQKDSVQAAKEWLETAYAQLAEKLPQLAEKLPQLAEKIPHPKKPSVQWCQEAFLEQAHQVGKKLKWW